MANAGALAAAVENVWTNAVLRRNGLDGGSLEVHNDIVCVRYKGLNFAQRVDLDYGEIQQLVNEVDSTLVRLTQMARRKVQRTPGCYYPH